MNQILRTTYTGSEREEKASNEGRGVHRINCTPYTCHNQQLCLCTNLVYSLIMRSPNGLLDTYMNARYIWAGHNIMHAFTHTTPISMQKKNAGQQQ